MDLQELSPIIEALLEMDADPDRVGLMDDAITEKITLRHLGPNQLRIAQPITGEEIRAIRERTKLSQSAFGRLLNLSTCYVSQLERGVKTLSGPALILLNVIRRKGLEAIF